MHDRPSAASRRHLLTVVLTAHLLLGGLLADRAEAVLAGSTTLPGSTLAGVVEGPNGLLYGVTYDGGTNSKGTIYSVDKGFGAPTVLHNFTGGADGQTPYYELTPGTGAAAGLLFGTNDSGVVFSFAPGTKTLTPLKTFGFPGPTRPGGKLVQIGDFLHGILSEGGTTGHGFVFRIKYDGTGYEVLHDFTGAEKSFGTSSMTLGPDGYLYGVSMQSDFGCAGTPFGCGTIWRLLPQPTNNDFKVIHTLSAAEGGYPQAGLVYSSDGYLYGSTFTTVFRILPSPGATLETLFTATGGHTQIFTPPIEGADKRLYVPQYDGGKTFVGSVFSLRKDGTDVRRQHAFSLTASGFGPYGVLFQDAAGTIFGTTEYSTLNPAGTGTVFKLGARGGGGGGGGPKVILDGLLAKIDCVQIANGDATKTALCGSIKNKISDIRANLADPGACLQLSLTSFQISVFRPALGISSAQAADWRDDLSEVKSAIGCP